jgi:hypothetical protein
MSFHYRLKFADDTLDASDRQDQPPVLALPASSFQVMALLPIEANGRS